MCYHIKFLASSLKIELVMINSTSWRPFPAIQYGQEITSQQFWEPAKVILSKWPIKSVEPVRQSVEHVRQSVVTFRQFDRLAYRFDKSHWSWSVWLEKNSLALDKMTWTESWKESSTKEVWGYIRLFLTFSDFSHFRLFTTISDYFRPNRRFLTISDYFWRFQTF